jgi:hypothetical protein
MADDTAGPLDGEPETEGIVNNADPAAVRRRTQKLKAQEELTARILRHVLQTPETRQWMWEVLEFCRVFHVRHVPGDPCGTAFNDGMGNVGLMLMSQIPPDIFKLMQDEQKNG